MSYLKDLKVEIWGSQEGEYEDVKSSGIWQRAVLEKWTNNSEVDTASTIRAFKSQSLHQGILLLSPWNARLVMVVVMEKWNPLTQKAQAL
jgi:hypothetical protein